MCNGHSQQAVSDHDEQIRELLIEIDEQASRGEDRWMEKRTHVRKAVRTACEVRFLGLDGETVVFVVGKTREISAGGMSFLSREHFARRAPLLVTLSVIPGKPRFLPGTVVYSRSVRENWYLTGLKFGPATDARLSPENYAQITAVDAYESQPEKNEESGAAPTRRRMLQILAMASIPGQRSKSLVAKVVTASASPDHVVRRASIPVLMTLGCKDGIAALILMLQDGNPTIAGEAAEALGMLGVPQAVGPLQQLLSHPEDEVAVRAAEALARMGSWGGKRVLLRLITREGPASRRAARALGMLVGCSFAPTAEGVTAARQYLRIHDI